MRQVPRVKQKQPYRKIIIHLFAFVISLILASSAILIFSKQNTNPTIPAYDSRSHLISSNHFYIIHLYGNEQQMGYAYGKLLKKQLSQFSKSINAAITQHQTQKSTATIALELYNHYPKKWQKFLLAVSQGAGIPLKKIEIINGFEHYQIFNSQTKPLPKKKIFGCDELFISTTTTVRQSHITPKKQYHVMRWYDYFNKQPQWRDKLLVTVFHQRQQNPMKPATQVAMITYLGTLNATTLINSNGLFLALNNGFYSARRMNKKYQTRNYKFAFSTIQLLDMFFHCKNISQIKHYMESHLPSTALIYNILDSKQHKIINYEVVPGVIKYKQLKKNESWWQANNFRNKSWQSYLLKRRQENINAGYTYLRTKNLKTAATEITQKQYYYNTKNAETYMQATLNNGGVSRPSTVMQLYFNPENSKKYLNIRIPPSGKFVSITKENLFE